MNCSSIDVKAIALGETPGEAPEHAHIAACESCREELDRLRLTRGALLSLPEEEIPQRIAFVSDKVFEPRWWQRMWRSGPAMGFASAAVLAAAIFAHAYARPANTAAAASTAQIQAQAEARLGAKMEARVEAEVAKRVDAAVARTVAETEARDAKASRLLEAAEKRFELQRESDVAMMQQTAHYWEQKMGRLMVASNNSYGGAQ